MGVLLLSGSTALIAQPVDIYAQDKSGTDTSVQETEPGFKVFQFPRLAIPRIDGEFSDWGYGGHNF